MTDKQEEVSGARAGSEKHGEQFWQDAYDIADAKGALPKRDAGKEDIQWMPEGKVDATFSSGEHTITSGICVARGDAKVHADGSAVVYAFDNADVDGKGTVTIYASGKSTATGNETSVVYARDNTTAYGFDESIVHAYDRTEVHAHDKPTVYAHDQSEINANDSSTTFAYDQAFVWAREPQAPTRDTVHAFDNVVVVTSQRPGADENSLRPKIVLHDNSLWIDYEHQFGNPMMHRTGNR